MLSKIAYGRLYMYQAQLNRSSNIRSRYVLQLRIMSRSNKFTGTDYAINH